MIITKKALPRRTFLRGMGATLALPLLDAMVPSLTALADDAGQSARCGGWASSTCRWAATSRAGRRRAATRSIELSPIAQLAGAGEGARHRHHATWSCRTRIPARTRRRTPRSSAPRRRSGPKAPTTTSARRSIRSPRSRSASDTQLPSLELSMDLLPIVGQCDNGYACVYQNNLSWSSPTTPLPAEAHPRIVFESLFGEGGSTAERRAALQETGQPARFGDARTSRACRTTLGPGDRDAGQPVSRNRPRSGAAHSEGRGRRDGESAAGSRSARRRARRVRRPRAADVRPAGAGAAGRHHARHHVPARARNQQPHLSGDRRFRSASSADASRQRSGKDREGWRRSTQFHVSLFAEFLEKLKATPEGNGIAARPLALSCTAAAWAIRTFTTT